MKCAISWIDENGKPTPDNNEAVGTAATRTVGPGLSVLDASWGEEHPICAGHLKRLRPRHVSWPGTDHEYVTEWRFTSYEKDKS